MTNVTMRACLAQALELEWNELLNKFEMPAANLVPLQAWPTKFKPALVTGGSSERQSRAPSRDYSTDSLPDSSHEVTHKTTLVLHATTPISNPTTASP